MHILFYFILNQLYLIWDILVFPKIIFKAKFHYSESNMGWKQNIYVLP